jgi:hypothetical protein
MGEVELIVKLPDGGLAVFLDKDFKPVEDAKAVFVEIRYPDRRIVFAQRA